MKFECIIGVQMKVVKFVKINQDAIIPDYAHEGDAGMDLYSVEDTVIEPNTLKKVNTGLVIELPKNTEAQVRSKSGIALKSQVFVLNSPGTIDENYRGEIAVLLYNLGKQAYEVKKGQKIAQLVINEICYVKTKVVENVSQTTRGEGGFGSTGLKRNKQ